MRERYGEGEVPHEAKTGGGPILLTYSFPYVRDWLNNIPLGIRQRQGLSATCTMARQLGLKPWLISLKCVNVVS